MYKKREAKNAEKGCFICFRPTKTVLINEKDFFYVCETHLSDRGFAELVDGAYKLERQIEQLRQPKQKQTKAKSTQRSATLDLPSVPKHKPA